MVPQSRDAILKSEGRIVSFVSVIEFHKGESRLPEQETIERANEDKAEGKAPSTQAGEFVKEEMDHIREGKHAA